MNDKNILDLIYMAHRKLSELESTPRDYGTGELLYSSDIHTVLAVAQHRGCNLTELAEKLYVSKPAASKFVKKMIQSEYIKKEQQQDSAKEVAYYLTEKGESAVKAHKAFTKKVFGPLEAIQKGLNHSDLHTIQTFLMSLNKAIKW